MWWIGGGGGRKEKVDGEEIKDGGAASRGRDGGRRGSLRLGRCTIMSL